MPEQAWKKTEDLEAYVRETSRDFSDDASLDPTTAEALFEKEDIDASRREMEDAMQGIGIRERNRIHQQIYNGRKPEEEEKERQRLAREEILRTFDQTPEASITLTGHPGTVEDRATYKKKRSLVDWFLSVWNTRKD